jgi:hypothetical protein
MDKKDAYLPGLRVPSELAEVFNDIKDQSQENFSEIGRELVMDFIRIAKNGERITRPARFVTDKIPALAGLDDMQCRLIGKDIDGSLIFRCLPDPSKN